MYRTQAEKIKDLLSYDHKVIVLLGPRQSGKKYEKSFIFVKATGISSWPTD